MSLNVVVHELNRLEVGKDFSQSDTNLICYLSVSVVAFIMCLFWFIVEFFSILSSNTPRHTCSLFSFPQTVQTNP